MEAPEVKDHDEPGAVSPRRVYGAVVLALGLAGALSTGRVLKVAERLPFGSGRTLLVDGLEIVDAAAHRIGLAAPSHGVQRARVALGLAPGDDGPVARLADGTASVGGANEKPPDADDPRAATAAALVRGAGGGSARAASGTAGANGVGGGSDTAGGTATAWWRTAGADRGAVGPSPTRWTQPTMTPPPARPISPDAPLRVIVAGDSFAQPLGFELQNFATRDGMTSVEVDGRISTGLARPDYFDWPAQVAVIADTTGVEAIVFFVGANDDQNMILDDDTVVEIASPEWTNAYAERAASLMDACREIRLYWVGLPVMRDADDHRAAAAVNVAVRRAAATRPWVKFIDIWETFQGPDGRFSLYLPDETGELIEVRGPDGVHLSRTGTNMVAAMLYNAFGRTWSLATPTPTPTATDMPTDMPTDTAEPTAPPTAPLPGARPPVAPSPPITPPWPVGFETATPTPRAVRPSSPRIVTATPHG